MNSYLENLDEICFLGELSLDGKINKVNGILPMCIEAVNLGIKKVVIPKENCKEAISLIQKDNNIYISLLYKNKFFDNLKRH